MADDNEDAKLSPDDALEPVDETIDSFVNQQPLEEDGDRPAAPADDVPGANTLAPDAQQFDADEDPDEVYQEGSDAAAGMPPESTDEP